MDLNHFVNIDYLKGYLSRIKPYFLISLVFFIITVLLGFLLADVFKSIGMQLLHQIVSEVPEQSITATYLFKNNLTVNLIIIAGGFLFSIISALVIFINGFIIGFTYWIIHNPILFILYILPHGIFELTATILSLGVSLMITRVVCRLIRGIFNKESTIKKEYDDSKIIIADILLSIFFIVILLVLAAFIEAYLTIPIANFFISFF